MCIFFCLNESILMMPECKCLRDEQNQQIVVCGETPASHSGSATGSVSAKKEHLSIFISLRCAILSLKALEEHAPVMQREQLWCKLMQPVKILVCIHQKSLS